MILFDEEEKFNQLQDACSFLHVETARIAELQSARKEFTVFDIQNNPQMAPSEPPRIVRDICYCPDSCRSRDADKINLECCSMFLLILCLSAKSHGINISYIRKASLAVIIFTLQKSHHSGGVSNSTADITTSLLPISILIFDL